MEWPKQAGMANMEIGAEPRYPTPCMLLTANTGVSEFEGHAPQLLRTPRSSWNGKKPRNRPQVRRGALEAR